MIEEDFIKEIYLVDTEDWGMREKQHLREQRQGNAHSTHERQILKKQNRRSLREFH